MGAGPRGNKDAKHVRIYDGMQMSVAWRSLSGNAVKLLLHVASFEKGDNNGSLFCSVRAAGEGIGVSKRTAMKAFHELEELGFLRSTQKGHFKVKGGPATCWRLTWRASPATRQGPTNEWRDWKPRGNKTRVHNLSDAGAVSTPLASDDVPTGAVSTPANRRNPQKLVEPTGAESSTHTVASGRACPGVIGAAPPSEAGIRKSALAIAKDRAAQVALATTSGIERARLDDFLHRGVCLPAASLARLNRALNGLAA